MHLWNICLMCQSDKPFSEVTVKLSLIVVLEREVRERNAMLTVISLNSPNYIFLFPVVPGSHPKFADSGHNSG